MKYPKCKITYNPKEFYPYQLWYKKSFFSFWTKVKESYVKGQLECVADAMLRNTEYPKIIHQDTPLEYRDFPMSPVNEIENPRLPIPANTDGDTTFTYTRIRRA